MKASLQILSFLSFSSLLLTQITPRKQECIYRVARRTSRPRPCGIAAYRKLSLGTLHGLEVIFMETKCATPVPEWLFHTDLINGNDKGRKKLSGTPTAQIFARICSCHSCAQVHFHFYGRIRSRFLERYPGLDSLVPFESSLVGWSLMVHVFKGGAVAIRISTTCWYQHIKSRLIQNHCKAIWLFFLVSSMPFQTFISADCVQEVEATTFCRRYPFAEADAADDVAVATSSLAANSTAPLEPRNVLAASERDDWHASVRVCDMRW